MYTSLCTYIYICVCIRNHWLELIELFQFAVLANFACHVKSCVAVERRLVMMVLFAGLLHYTAMLFLFLCVPLFGRWRRRSNVPMGRRSYKRMQRCQPAVLQRAQTHRKMIFLVIFACCLCIQLVFHMCHYGTLYGSLLLIIHYGQTVSMHAPKSHGMARMPCAVPHSPHIRWRGGAMTDPGTATCDASVDVEMFVS